MIMVVMITGCGPNKPNNPKISSVVLEQTGTSVDIGETVTLPTFATATWSDGAVTSIAVLWNTTKVDTSKEGSTTYKGTVSGWDGTVSYTVTVKKGQEKYIQSVYLTVDKATVAANTTFTLPAVAIVKWSKGEDTEAAITWDKTVDTSKEGTYTFIGKVDGYDAGTVKFVLNVGSAINKIEKVYLESASGSVPVGTTVKLPTTAKAVWTTGDITSSAVTWDKTVDTSKEGTYIFTGTVSGTKLNVTYVLTVGPKITVKTLSLDITSAAVEKDSSYALPVYGTVTYSDNITAKKVTVTWNKTVSTATVGTFYYTASYTEDGVTVTKVFTLIVGTIDKKIVKLTLSAYSASVEVGATFILPSEATAVYNTGTTGIVKLTWDKTVDTSKEGTYTFTGSAENTTQTVVYTLKVGGPVDPTITGLTLDVNTSTVKPGAAFALPTTATATLNNGETKPVAVTWDKAVDTSKEGTYTFLGSVSGTTLQVVYTLIVDKGVIVTVQKLTLATTTGNTSVGNTTFKLPTTGTVTYTDATTKPVAVVWDRALDLTKEGTFVYTASYTENGTTVKATYTVVVTGGIQPVKAKTIAFATNKVTVQAVANGTYKLPATVTATYDNNTTKEVTITTWSPSATADISAVGTTSYVAIFTETYSDGKTVTLTAVYTVEVIKEIPAKTLSSIALSKTSDTVNKGTTYTLPTTATATYSNGETATVTVAWDKTVSTAAAGTTVYTASYTENGVTAKAPFSLTVNDDKVTVTSFTIGTTEGTVAKGALYTLPETGTITYSNGTTKTATVTWNKGVNTGTVGEYEYIGSNTEAGTLTVKFKLNVVDGTTPVLTLSDISEVKAGETFEVAVNASFFSKSVAAVDVRLSYDTTMVKGLDDATSMIQGMKIVKHINGEQDISVVLDTAAPLSGTIFKVKFKALKDGKTAIKFGTKTELLGTAGDKITVTTTDTGVVSIGTGGTVTYSKLMLSDAETTTTGDAEITVSAEEFTETSVGIEVVLNYDTTYLDLTRDANGNPASSIVTLLNSSFWSDLVVVKEATKGKLTIAIITNKTTPITLNGDLFKVKFKSTGAATTGTTVSFGEVKIANSTDGFISAVTTTDTGAVKVTQVQSSSALTIADATGSYPGYVNVTLAGNGFAEKATGVEFIVSYDSNYLEIENLSTDVNLTGVLAGGQKIVSVPSAGKVKISAVIYNETFTANGNLATIKFKAKKAGTTTVSYANVDVANAAATGKMTVTATDTGAVTINQVVSTPTTVELTASSTSFTAGGSSTLTAVVKDQNGNVMSSEAADIYNGTTKAGSSTYVFTTSTEGTYKFTAKSGILTSTEVTVTVNKAGEVITGGPYATNAVGVGKSKTITIDGTFSDWSDDMLIAQGAAWDIANKWKGGHENCVLDSYSLYAAWDDTNLYIAWQMVNTTDLWAREGEQSLSDGGRVLDVPLIIALNTGKKTAMTGKMANGKLLWDALQLEFKTSVDHLFLMSGKVGLGTPAMFTAADAAGGASYTAPYCQNFKATGIKYAMAMDSLPKQIMMLDGTTVLPADVTSSTAVWIDAVTKSHNRKYDSFYEMSIPLSVLGIDKAYIESNGIGAMQIATRGVSAIDSLPHDSTTLDNVMGDCAVDPSSSHEKDDTDTFTVPLAKIGKK